MRPERDVLSLLAEHCRTYLANFQIGCVTVLKPVQERWARTAILFDHAKVGGTVLNPDPNWKHKAKLESSLLCLR
jgi:hypothetical protein